MVTKSSSGSSRSPRTASASTSRSATSGVSAARLQQKSGTSNAFGGFTKVNHGNGTFSMRTSTK